MKHYLFLIVLTAFVCLAFAGCAMDDESDYGKLVSTYDSEDCITKTYEKENSITGEFTRTTVRDCRDDRIVYQTVIY